MTGFSMNREAEEPTHFLNDDDELVPVPPKSILLVTGEGDLISTGPESREYKRWQGRRVWKMPVQVRVVSATKVECVKPDDGPNDILSKVARAFGITVRDLISKRRKKNLIVARAVAVRLLREKNPSVYSFPYISSLLGGRDHSTMIHSYREFPVYMKQYPKANAVYQAMGGEGCKL